MEQGPWACKGEFPVRPLESGMISIGEEKMLGMPAVFKECQALAEYVVGEFDASGVQAGVVVQEYLDGPQNDYLLSVQRNYPGRFFFHALPNFLIEMRLCLRVEIYLNAVFEV